MILAGMPTAVVPAGTELRTTALAPIAAPFPIVSGPLAMIFAPAPIMTPSSMTIGSYSGAILGRISTPMTTCELIHTSFPITVLA
jgi:hypothetical protein